ncbi:MAG: cupin [Alphaproteobacteria bacterium]|jgi:predicted cupin superfamily sugar epimerase|nr:cupin [Alphaproteobacteria bacterium]
MTPEELIARLGLRPHPEGGHYVETYRAPASDGERAAVSCIYYLLRRGERSRWHRVDASEVWHWQAGDALALDIAGEDGVVRHRVGPELAGDDVGHAVVPAFAWQSAQSLGAWTLVSCTVAPGFTFAGFELAPDGFDPGGS